MKVKGESEVTQTCTTLSDPMGCSLSGSVHGIFPGKSTGVGCPCLLWLIQRLIINFGFSEMILISYCGKLSRNIINEVEKSTLSVMCF